MSEKAQPAWKIYRRRNRIVKSHLKWCLKKGVAINPFSMLAFLEETKRIALQKSK